MTNGNGLKTLKDYWFILLAFVTVVGMGYRLIAMERSYASHCEQEIKQNDIIQEAKTRLGKLETDVDWLKGSSVRIESMLQDIQKELRE